VGLLIKASLIILPRAIPQSWWFVLPRAEPDSEPQPCSGSFAQFWCWAGTVVHTTGLAQDPEPFQRWSLANIWLGDPSALSDPRVSLASPDGPMLSQKTGAFNIPRRCHPGPVFGWKTGPNFSSDRHTKNVCGTENRCTSALLDLLRRTCFPFPGDPF